MNQDKLSTLLKKYRTHTCTPEESKELDEWYDQFEEAEEDTSEVSSWKLKQLWKGIDHKLGFTRRRVVKITCGIAASLALSIGIPALYQHVYHQRQIQVRVADNLMLKNQGRALLELGNGECVFLDRDTILLSDNDIAVSNNIENGLDYSSIAESQPNRHEKGMYNVLRVPKGGEYRVVLEDGTVVYMNSCSSLKYPVPFSKHCREVELQGEAFFDVAKTGNAFIVHTEHMRISVLGTSFNVSDYTDDAFASTTLVTGKVSVADPRTEDVMEVTPGHTFLYDLNTDKKSLEKGNEHFYLAWREGIFRFENMRLEDIILKLKRWYDFEVDFVDESLKNIRFSGAAEKDKPLNYLLDMMSTVTEVRFEMKNGRIRILSD